MPHKDERSGSIRERFDDRKGIYYDNRIHQGFSDHNGICDCHNFLLDDNLRVFITGDQQDKSQQWEQQYGPSLHFSNIV
jgi:hypothetical protein